MEAGRQARQAVPTREAGRQSLPWSYAYTPIMYKEEEEGCTHSRHSSSPTCV